MPPAAEPSRSQDLPDLAGARATVMGLGRFGGGLGVTRYLLSKGARVTLTDTAPASELRESLDTLGAHESDAIASGTLALRLGAHEHADFEHADLIVANPAIKQPWNNPFLRTAETAGVSITTEIELTIAAIPPTCPTIAITGSAGKSTTSAMIACALGAAHERVHLGGNIGGSLLDTLARIEPGDPIVLELSSAMLSWLSRARTPSLRTWSPTVAVVTGLSPNHLDWHGTLEHYRTSKQHLLAHAPGASVLLGEARSWATPPETQRIEVDGPAALPPLLVPGAHNRLNATAALEACAALGRLGGPHADTAAFTERLASFPGLPHRLCTIATLSGIRFIDDSKSTTPESALLALDALASEGPLSRVHLIAGGADKGADLRSLARRAPELGSFTVIGTTAAALRAASPDAIEVAESLDAAVERAIGCARGGSPPDPIVLLSPGCASWDQFDHFEHRGRIFAEAVHARGAIA